MGGLMFIFGILAGTLAFSLSATELVLPALLCTVGFALVGFLDDFLKVRCKNTVGLRAYQKIIAQFLIAAIVAAYALQKPLYRPQDLPAFSGLEWDLGVFYIPFIMFVIIATVNSVNLTDGLDGLSSGVTLIYSLTMGVIFLYLATAMKIPMEWPRPSRPNMRRSCNPWAYLPPRWREDAWVSSGITAIRPGCSWGIPVPWPWGARWR